VLFTWTMVAAKNLPLYTGRTAASSQSETKAFSNSLNMNRKRLSRLPRTVVAECHVLFVYHPAKREAKKSMIECHFVPSLIAWDIIHDRHCRRLDQASK
jgi:hypothetical protein